MQKQLRIFFFWVLLTSPVIPSHAQKKGYYQGYIINEAGEIIEGRVKDRSPGTYMELYRRIRFKKDDALLKRKYSPDEILGYGFNDQHFEAVPLYEETAFFRFRYLIDESHGRVFLKIISSDADLTYFHWEYVDSESNYLDYIPLFYRDGSDGMVRVSQGILGLKRKRLAEYFRDCPELVRAIDKKELTGIDEVYYFYLDHCARDTY